MITLAYASPDPQLAARVLNELAKLYLDKHAAVTRPSGTTDFFRQEADQYRKGLQDAEARLVAFTNEQGVVDGQIEKELALRKLNQFDVELRTTEAGIAETGKRIRTLETEAKSRPSRITTQMKTGERMYMQLRGARFTPAGENFLAGGLVFVVKDKEWVTVAPKEYAKMTAPYPKPKWGA